MRPPLALLALLILGCARSVSPTTALDQQLDTDTPAAAAELQRAATLVSPLAPPALKQDATSITLIPEELVFRRVSQAQYGAQGPDFYLLETEVTNAIYARYLLATGRSKGDEETVAKAKAQLESRSISTIDPVYLIDNRTLLWSGNKPPPGMLDFPVALLDVHQAAGFCEWLTKRYPELGTFRFPTDEEWLIAAYGAERKYPWGDSWDARLVCMSEGAKPDYPFEPLLPNPGAKVPKWNEPRTSPEPVRLRPGGRTPEGIYGMWGNVSEYVLAPQEVRNFRVPGLGARWLGGSFQEREFKPRMSYWGYTHSSYGRSEKIGFRVSLDITDKKHEYEHPVWDAPPLPDK